MSWTFFDKFGQQRQAGYAGPQTPGWQQISDYTVTGSVLASYDTNTVLGGNIPQTYNHLRLIVVARGDTGSASTSANLRFNNDSGANYMWERLISAVAAVSGSNLTGATGGYVGDLSAASDSAARAGLSDIWIPSYTTTTFSKNYQFSNYSVGPQQVVYGAGNWANTAAVTRIQLFPGAGNWVVGSRFTLEGIL